MSKNLLDQCRFPPLNPPYDEALRQAVRFILSYVNPLGIIVSGTIILGHPHPNSDLDINVLHIRNQRQRVQRRFDGVPAEIFINPAHKIEEYFNTEKERPMSANMWATGFVILDRDPVVEQLRSKARLALSQSPDYSDTTLLFTRYEIADRYENAQDIQHEKPEAAVLMLGLAVVEMLRYSFMTANRILPRDKDLIEAIAELDPPMAQLARDFVTAEPARKFRLAEQIADRTIGVRGFFEWDSPWEDV